MLDSLRLTVCLALAALAGVISTAAQEATPLAAPATLAQTAAPPPFPNRANEALPSWLRVRGELRGRVEGASGIGFVEQRDDHYFLSRVRLQATVTPAPLLSFQVQAQDARVARKAVGPTGSPFSAPLDLRVASADVGNAQTPISLRAGRQELAFGEQRLVGHVGWLNAARSFDGARVTMRGAGVQVDAFATSVVRSLPGELDKSGAGNRFVGAYAVASRLVPRGSIEPYVFWRRDGNRAGEFGGVGTLSQTTAGVRLVGPLPGRLEYGVEMALQRGSLDADSIRAWAGHWRLRQSLPGRGTVRLTGEYNYASGDADPADGIRGTFDVLYPTPHDKYGLADQVGWKNIHHARAGVELTPWRGLPVGVAYHSWWVADRRDGVYTAGGALLARVPGGAARRHVGQEIDVQASRSVTPQLQLAAGYAHIVPGPFLEEATPGASYSHPYVMVTYVFLAER